MKRRKFLAGGMALLALPRLSAAETKTPTLGLLWNDSVKPSPYVAIVTAVWTLSGELNRKRMELLKQAAPTVSRVGILFASGSAVQTAVDEADVGAHALKLEIIKQRVQAPDEIEAAVASLAKSRVGAI